MDISGNSVGALQTPLDSTKGFGSSQRANNTLTEEQTSALGEIIAQYNPEGMTQEERRDMKAAIKDAGIPPSHEVRSALEDAGFQGPRQAGMGGPGGPPNIKQSMTDEESVAFDEILAQYDPEEMTRADYETLRDDIQAAGIEPSLEIRQTLEESGFNVQKGPPPPPPPQKVGESGLNGTSDLYQALIDAFSDSDDSAVDSLLSTLDAQNEADAKGNLFDRKG